jgi:hypothetical protein
MPVSKGGATRQTIAKSFLVRVEDFSCYGMGHGESWVDLEAEFGVCLAQGLFGIRRTF